MREGTGLRLHGGGTRYETSDPDQNPDSMEKMEKKEPDRRKDYVPWLTIPDRLLNS
jgi:hypothetical protein